jgi:hypothetical protein
MGRVDVGILLLQKRMDVFVMSSASFCLPRAIDISEANFDFLDVGATGRSSLKRGCMRRCHGRSTTTGGWREGVLLGDISSDANVEGDGLKTMRGDRELLEGRERIKTRKLNSMVELR